MLQGSKQLVIWGASGHARVIVDIIRLSREFTVVGFLDNINTELHGKMFCQAPILGGLEQLEELKFNNINTIFLAIGNCQARLKLAAILKVQKFNLATLIHPNAVIASDVTIGDGTVIMAGAVINSGARIGENVIVNTSASIDHDCLIEDGVHISPGAHLAGHVCVSRGVWIGIGAVVSDRITIGESSVIGAGSVVIRDIPAGVVAYGVPAKVIRSIDSST
jgi:UDP-N-acetylbacillosamine N-acetyltransferase